MLNLIVNVTKQRFIQSQRNPQRVSFLHGFSPFRRIWFLSEYQGKCKKMAPERDIGVKNKYQYPSLLSPPVQLARWALMRHFRSVCLCK